MRAELNRLSFDDFELFKLLEEHSKNKKKRKSWIQMFNNNGSNVSGKDLVNLSDILETQKEEIYKEGIIFFWKKEQDNYLVFPDFSAKPLENFEGSLDSQMFSSKRGSILFVQGMIERRTGIFLNKWLISSEIKKTEK